MKPLVLLTQAFLPEVLAQELAPFAEIKIANDRTTLNKLIPRAQGLLTSFSDPIDEALLKRAVKLKVIANVAVGINNIDLQACAKRRIRVCNTPEVLTRATAECALTLLLACARRLPEGERLCRKGQFKGWKIDLLLGLELKGRRAVLVGPGRIGKETAKLFRAIGIKVKWIKRGDSENEIRAKLSEAQIISLHCPLTSETHHWLNARRLSCLPFDAIVINTTRGACIEERALISALKKRKIFSAGLDVFEFEPKIPKALIALPNVVLLPHLGSATLQTRQAMVRLAARGVVGVLSGKPPPNEVKFRHGNE